MLHHRGARAGAPATRPATRPANRVWRRTSLVALTADVCTRRLAAALFTSAVPWPWRPWPVASASGVDLPCDLARKRKAFES
jgi:hypothetical protein